MKFERRLRSSGNSSVKLTFPQDLLKYLNLGPLDRVTLEVIDNTIVIKKQESCEESDE